MKAFILVALLTVSFALNDNGLKYHNIFMVGKGRSLKIMMNYRIPNWEE